MTHRLHRVARALQKLKKCQYCYLAPAQGRGLGVFAARPFQKGEIVMMDRDGDFFDEVMTLEELCRSEIFDYPLQVGRNAYRIPTGGIEDFTNHSCDPSTGIRQVPDGIMVMALKEIAIHDEITFDYSTWLGEESLQFVCTCGSSGCRGMVTTFAKLPDDLKARYVSLDIVGAYILDEVDAHTET